MSQTLSKTKIRVVFEQLQKLWPDAHCELEHYNHFQLLIAVILSAQATDKSVNKALAPLFVKIPNFGPVDLEKLGEGGFYEWIRSINFAPTKARNCFKTAQILNSALFEGVVPLNREDLESLPGVGRKTANVILNVVCGLPTMAVDTHVARVSQRLGLVTPTQDRLKIEEQLLSCVPKEFAVQAHHQLIFHGRYLCSARAPKCSACSLQVNCLKVGL